VRKGLVILLLGLAVSAAAFSGLYYFGTAPGRDMMREPEPELAWLKKEFHLTDSEYTRICQMHEAYLPRCRERCARIAEQDRRLEELLAQTNTMTSEIQNVIVYRASIRAECETEMLKHFLAVSRTMPTDQGRRYLAWVEEQTCLRGQGMEERHHLQQESPMAGHHHHHN